MLKKLLSLLSDVMTYGASSVLGQIIGVVLLPVYTRYLVPAEQWEIQMLILLGLAFGPLGHLGMTSAIFRRYSAAKTEHERGEAMSTALVSTIVSCVAATLFGALFAGGISTLIVGDARITHLVWLTLVSAAITTVGSVPMSMLRAARRVRVAAIINVSKLLVITLATIFLVVGLEWGVRGVVVGTLIGEAAVGTVLVMVTLRSFRVAPRLASWKRLISYGLPFVPHQLQGLLTTSFGQYWVGHALGATEGGLYAIAVRFSMPLAFVVNSVQNAWTAFKFEIHTRDENPPAVFRSIFTYYAAAVLYLWVGVSYWGPEIVYLMTYQTYHPAAWLVPAACLVPLAQGCYFMLSTGIGLTDDTRSMPLISFAGLLATIACSVLLVSQLGAAGAAVATASGWAAMALVAHGISQRRILVPYDWPSLVCFASLAAAAVYLGYATRELPLGPRLARACVVSLAFPLAEFAILCRSTSERHRMQILLSKFRLAPSGR